MSADDAADRSVSEQEVRARKAAADSLRRQIENLKADREPRTLNEFVERKMAEGRKKEQE
jgi:hypothetical protein